MLRFVTASVAAVALASIVSAQTDAPTPSTLQPTTAAPTTAAPTTAAPTAPQFGCTGASLTQVLNPSDVNGILAPTASSYGGGQTAAVDCRSGFARVDHAPYQCTAANTWSNGRITCQPVSCGSPVPDGSNAVAPASCNTTYNSNCTVQCADGHSGPTVVRRCLASGTWSETVQCTAQTCQTSSGVAGTALATLRREFLSCTARPGLGSTCVATCREGFQGDAAPYTCTAPSGGGTPQLQHLGGVAAACTPVTCSLQSLRAALALAQSSTTDPAVGTGWADATAPTTFNYGGDASNGNTCPAGGATCTFTPTCAAGFHSVGTPSEFRCIGPNRWSAGWRECRRLPCGSPTEGAPNAVAPSSCNTTYGSTCPLTCTSGYTNVGSRGASPLTRTCGQGGSWTPVSVGAFSCQPVQCPATGVLPSDAGFGTDCPASARTFGGSCTARCLEGFEGTAVAYRCMANGRMQADQSAISCTPVTCSHASLLGALAPDSNANTGTGNGVRVPPPGPPPYAYNAVHVPSCDTGFEPTVPDVVSNFTCTATNTWTGGRIRCRPKLCEPLRFATALLTESVGGGACVPRHGASCTSTCMPGYRSISLSHTCVDGSWTSVTAPACGCPTFNAAQVRVAGSPNALPPAQIDRFTTGTCPATARGGRCTALRCEPGFQLEGVLSCSTSDEWVGRVRCVPTVELKTGSSTYFEGPGFSQYAPSTVVGYATPPVSGTSSVDVTTRAWVVPSVPSGGVGVLRALATNEAGSPEIVRLNVTTAGYTPLTLTSSQYEAQQRDGSLIQLPLGQNLNPGLLPFRASGGSGEYAFTGSGQEALPSGSTSTWSVFGGGAQYRLSRATADLTPGTTYTIYVTVVDRQFGTSVSVSLRFAVVDALRAVVSTDVDRATDVPELTSVTNSVYDVTEGGPFNGTVLAAGVTQAASDARRCSLLNITDVTSPVLRNTSCAAVNSTLASSPGTTAQTVPCNATCFVAGTAGRANAPWCYVNATSANASAPAAWRYCGSSDTCEETVRLCNSTLQPYACPPVANQWRFGLPGGLSLDETTCEITGTLAGNWPANTFSTDPLQPIQIRANISVNVPDGTSGSRVWAYTPVIFRVFAPVAVRVIRTSLGSGAAASDLSLTEDIDVGTSYQAQIVLSGGKDPFIPLASVRLPQGLTIERVFQIRGTPTAETVQPNGTDVVERQFSFGVDNAYEFSPLEVVDLSYRVGENDCSAAANGPNSQACAAQGTCNDTDRFDRSFACSCDGGYTGDNCESAPVLAAAGGGGGSDNSGVTIAVVCVVFILLAAVGVGYMWYQRQLLNKPFDFEAEMAKMVEQGTLAQLDGERKVPKELKRNRITMLDKLGSGAFGDVNKGLYDPEIAGMPEFAVAIKVLKDQPTREEREELMKEATVSAQFNHDNVVQCIGVVTAGAPVMLVLQLCDKGSMHSLLKKADMPVEVDIKGKYCLDVVLGMDYLASLGFVHRDLAARNVLVDAKNTAKIADFGLSRDTEDNDYYVAKAGKVPIRWTAPEALSARKFSEASDVWAFAITCIEVFTDAATPYKGWMNAFVLEQVLDGYQHPRPPQCPEGMYQHIIVAALAFSPKERPNFAQLAERVVGYFEGTEWLGIAGPDSVARAKAAAAIETIKSTQQANPEKARERYSALTMLAPACPEFKAQTHRKVYCGNCFKKNCQKDPAMEEADDFPASALASLMEEQERIPENHGRIDEDEAEMRLRERRDDEPELSFPERAAWLLREVDERTCIVSLLSNSTYGHHALEFGDDLKWRERGKDGVSFGGSLLGAAKTLLDDLQLGHLKGVPCSPENKGVNSHASYSSNALVANFAAAEAEAAAAAAAAADAAHKWWAADLPKSAVRAAVGDAGSGCFMIRKSSRNGTVVLVINDNGMCVDYAIGFDENSKRWSFVGQDFDRMDDLLDFLHGEPLTSKTGGYDVVLKGPAPGGVEVNLEKELFGLDLPDRDPAKSVRVESVRNKAYQRVKEEKEAEAADAAAAAPAPVPAPAPASIPAFEPSGGDDGLPPENAGEDDYEQMDHSRAHRAKGAGAGAGGAEAGGGADAGGAGAGAAEGDLPPEDPDDEYILPTKGDVPEGGATGQRPTRDPSGPMGFGDEGEAGGQRPRRDPSGPIGFGDEGDLPPENLEADYVNTRSVPELGGSEHAGHASEFDIDAFADGAGDDAPPASPSSPPPPLPPKAGRDGDDDGVQMVLNPHFYNGEENGGDAGAAADARARPVSSLSSDGVDAPNVAVDTAPVHKSGLDRRESSTDASGGAGAGAGDGADLFWVPAMNKNEVTKRVSAGETGTFLIRPSSKSDQVVLVCNDSGKAVSYPVKYNGAEWSFATMKAPTLNDLVESLRVEQITGTRGPDYSLTKPASGGARFDFAKWSGVSPSSKLDI